MRLPPALAAAALPRILELLPDPPARVLELGFAGVHAVPLRLAGYEVVVVEPDATQRARARERAGDALADTPPAGRFDAVVAPDGVAVPAAPLVVRVRQDGSVWSTASP